MEPQNKALKSILHVGGQHKCNQNHHKLQYNFQHEGNKNCFINRLLEYRFIKTFHKLMASYIFAVSHDV